MAACLVVPAAAGGLESVDLDGSVGMSFHGQGSTLSGHVVADAGDFNNDGLNDLLITAISDDAHGFATGAAYLIFATRGPLPAVRSLATLTGRDGVVFNGVASGDFAGIDAASAGDLNDDGIGDIIIGAYAADPNGASSGQSYVVFGTVAPWPAVFELADLDGTNGFALNGVQIFERSGRSVSAAGDVNADGIDDIVIGALNAPASGAASGRAYVVFGHAGPFPAVLELATLDGANGFAFRGAAAGDHAGVAVTGPCDLNADGLDDVVIGASDVQASRGAAYVIYGRAAAYPALLSPDDLDGVAGFTVLGASALDSAGLSLAAGDVNADGHRDLLIGALGADNGGSDAGAAYVVPARRGGYPAILDLGAPDDALITTIVGAAAGDKANQVGFAGDVNGDGVGDVAVGAPEAAPNGTASGTVHVVFGRSVWGRRSTTVELATLQGADGFRFDGAFAADRTGTSVSGAGDLNGDGVADVAFGAPEADPAGSLSGVTYVVFGSADDCNDNGAVDPIEVACGDVADVNGNGRPDSCDPDLDGDGAVTMADLELLLAAWGPCTPLPCDADLDGDGTVGTSDLLALLAAWG